MTATAAAIRYEAAHSPPRQLRTMPACLRDRFVVVTGGSSGIGKALAAQLAAAGASVLVGSRRSTTGGFEHRPLDLAPKASVVAFANGLVEDGRPIDMLVLNAGVHVPGGALSSGSPLPASSRSHELSTPGSTLLTVDGQELHWQVNYLSNFLLSHRLLELCGRSALKRILYVASEAHRLAALPGARLLRFWYRYARSKEAAITFFLRLQELHPELNVRIASPGYVDSEIHGHKGRLAAWLERSCSRARTADVAAREILACFAPAARGVYWDRGSPATAGRRCTDAARADALWQASLDVLHDVLPAGRAPQRITNYAGTFRGFGPPIERPSRLEELKAVVRRAADAGKSVRVVGQRHSYNDSFYSRTCMVSLERFDRVLCFDVERGLITCEGGISIGAMCQYLDDRGYALRYCGNYGKQTLAGAVATGTHGYGRDGGVMSELVRGGDIAAPGRHAREDVRRKRSTGAATRSRRTGRSGRRDARGREDGALPLRPRLPAPRGIRRTPGRAGSRERVPAVRPAPVRRPHGLLRHDQP